MGGLHLRVHPGPSAWGYNEQGLNGPGHAGCSRSTGSPNKPRNQAQGPHTPSPKAPVLGRVSASQGGLHQPPMETQRSQRPAPPPSPQMGRTLMGSRPGHQGKKGDTPAGVGPHGPTPAAPAAWPPRALCLWLPAPPSSCVSPPAPHPSLCTLSSPGTPQGPSLVAGRTGAWVVGSAGEGEAGRTPGRSPQPEVPRSPWAEAGPPVHPISLPSPHAGAVVTRGEAKTQVSAGPGQVRTPGRTEGDWRRSPGKMTHLGSVGRTPQTPEREQPHLCSLI